MIDYLFLTLPNSFTYCDLKKPLTFSQELQPYACWAFKQPLTIYSKDLKQKHTFSDQTVEVEKVTAPNLQEKWKYFVMTRSNSNRIYCTSYVFYQKCVVKIQQNSFFQINGPLYTQAEFYLPKCLVIKSEKPYYKLQTNLIKIHRELRKDNSFISNSIEKQSANNIKLKLRQSFVSAGKRPQFNLKNQNKQNQIESLFNYYIWAANQNLNKDKIYICPRSGLEVLHTYNISESLYRFNYFFHLPISMQNLAIILSAILQEKQIIFTSNNQNSNLMLMETLLQMLRPLKWEYMYVPNLPESMLDAAEHSFMPYMVGIHRKYLDRISTSGRVVVYVDSDFVKTDQQIPALPLILKKMLMLSEQNVGNLKYLEWESQMRIKSILFVTALLIQFPIVELKHTQNIDYAFYSFFFEKSAMYSTFKQQMFKQVNVETVQLFWLPIEIKIKMLQKRFGNMLLQASEPIICENDKQWVRYYLANLDQNKKSLKKSIANSWSRSTLSDNYLRSSILASTASLSQTRQPAKQKLNTNHKKKIGFLLGTIRQ